MAEKAAQAPRQAPIKVGELGYRMVTRDLAEIPVPMETPLQGELADAVRYTVDQWLGKKVHPFRTVDHGHAIAKKRTGRNTFKVQNSDEDGKRKISHRFEERAAHAGDVMVAKLCTRSDEGEEYWGDLHAKNERGELEDLSGTKVEPWVHVVCVDGSQADLWLLELPEPKSSGKAKDDGKGGESK